MKNLYRVYDMTTSGDFTISTKSNVIIDSADVVRYIRRKYGCFLFPSFYDKNITIEENITSAISDFYEVYKSFLRVYAPNIDRMYTAITADYNPIENYDRKEEGSILDAHHKGSITTTTTDEEFTPNTTTTTINTPNTTTTTNITPSAKTKNTEYAYGFNSESEVPTNSTVSELVEGKNITETTQSGTDTTNTTNTGTNKSHISVSVDYRDKSDSVFDKDVKTFDGYRVHGNVGVTKAQEMIEDELSLRKKSIAFMLLDMFIDETCIYIDSAEVVENEPYFL